MYDDVQRYSRTKMVLPLRVWLDDRATESSPALWAHTIDTSESGCRIGGLRTELAPGQIITLQRGKHKAAFRVIWSKQLEPHENQAGVEALENGIPIWLANSVATSAAAEPVNPSSRLHPTSATASSAGSALKTTHATAQPRLQPKHSHPQSKTLQKSALAPNELLYFGLVAALAIFSLGIGLYLSLHVFSGSNLAEFKAPVPAPPTAEDLARLTPKPHLMPVSLSKPLDLSPARVEVAEAPTGHIVYPVAPDDLTTGKVHLQIVVAANGLVKQIHVLSGKQPLAEAAAQAIRMWHYASLAGTGPFRERETTVTVSFVGPDAVSLQFPRAQSLAQSSRDN
ncbi:MAG: energy transducer TonB [Terriglobales bacterium]